MQQSRIILGVSAAFLFLSCGPMSDSAASQAAHRREVERRARAARTATAQTPPGRKVEGAELEALLRDKTHFFIYETDPSGRRGRYVESFYFRPDGRLIYTNTSWVTDSTGAEGDAWRVEGDRLCYLNSSFSSDERCYTVAVREDGRIQYSVHEPGNPMHGLLTKATDDIRAGHAVAK